MIKSSLIISVYKKIDYLKLVLAGLERQTFRDFEIIIADDGSRREFVEEIEKLSTQISFPLIHLWQEDKGFRKNKILNRAIVVAQSEHLIFIDGDCIPHKEFIREHYVNRAEGVCLTGRRVNLSERITNRLNPENVKEGILENYFFLIEDGLLGKTYDVEKGFYFKNKFLRKYFNIKKRGLLGCNFSIPKNNFLKINGFDERYNDPAIGEDTDVQFRLELEEIKIKSLNNIAIQYHLYHKLQPRQQRNLDIFKEVQSSRLSFTPFGIKKL